MDLPLHPPHNGYVVLGDSVEKRAGSLPGRWRAIGATLAVFSLALAGCQARTQRGGLTRGGDETRVCGRVG